MTVVNLLLLLSLMSYRLARMATQEDGPFDAFTLWRQRVGQKTWIGRGFHCVACASFYVAGLAALYCVLIGIMGWREFPLIWFAAAGGGLVIYQVAR